MKLSPLFCASFVALAALALTAEGAFAANAVEYGLITAVVSVALGKGGSKACIDGGGKVSTDKSGQTICTTPVKIATPTAAEPMTSAPRSH